MLKLRQFQRVASWKRCPHAFRSINSIAEQDRLDPPPFLDRYKSIEDVGKVEEDMSEKAMAYQYFWIRLTAQEQLDFERKCDALNKKDWRELSVAEKQLLYLLSYEVPFPNDPNFKYQVIGGAFLSILAASAIFLSMMYYFPGKGVVASSAHLAKMDEVLAKRNVDPISGRSNQWFSNDK